MEQRLSIGEFARACGLSRSALRFYDQHGLLAPAWVDGDTGYRFYAVAQLEDARLIRRLRAAELPVALLREYLAATPAGRVAILERHARAFADRAAGVQRTLADLCAESRAGARWCAVAAPALAEAIAQVSFAMADPGDRPELAVIWLERRDASLRLVATDSYRLAVRDLVPDAPGAGPLRGAIGAARVDALCRQLSGGRSVTLRQDSAERLTAEVDGVVAEVGGAAPDFPEYERILSELPTGAEAVVDRHTLVRALQQLPAGVGRVALHLRADGVALEAGAGPIPVGGDWPGPELTVWLAAGLLADAVGAAVGPDVTIEAVGPLAPVTLRSADTGTFSVLTMPIRP